MGLKKLNGCIESCFCSISLMVSSEIWNLKKTLLIRQTLKHIPEVVMYFYDLLFHHLPEVSGEDVWHVVPLGPLSHPSWRWKWRLPSFRIWAFLPITMIIKRLLRVVSQRHQQAPSVLLCASHQGLWTSNKTMQKTPKTMHLYLFCNDIYW